MKKLIGIVALIMGLFLFSGCDKDEKINPEDIESIVKDEQAWNDAFEQLNYENFTLSFHAIQDGNVGTNAIGELKYTKDCFYFKSRDYGKDEVYRESYIRRLEEGYQEFYCRIYPSDHTTDQDYFMYSVPLGHINQNHYLTIDEALKDPKIWVVESLSNEGVQGILAPIIIEISFSEKFEQFTYNAELKTYSYDGEILATLPYDNDYEVSLKNPWIQFKDGKVIALKCTMIVPGGSLEYTYTNIGTTENIIIPKDVEESAIKS